MISIYNIYESVLDADFEKKSETNLKRERSKVDRKLKKIIETISKAGNWEVHICRGKYDFKQCTLGFKAPDLIKYLSQANTIDVSKYMSVGFEVRIGLSPERGTNEYKIKYSIYLSKFDPKYCTGGFPRWSDDLSISEGEIMMKLPTLGQIIKPYILPEIKDLDTLYKRFSELTHN
jgi:hypothetical protein